MTQVIVRVWPSAYNGVLGISRQEVAGEWVVSRFRVDGSSRSKGIARSHPQAVGSGDPTGAEQCETLSVNHQMIEGDHRGVDLAGKLSVRTIVVVLTPLEAHQLS